jgi:hypothetical protein
MLVVCGTASATAESTQVAAGHHDWATDSGHFGLLSSAHILDFSLDWANYGLIDLCFFAVYGGLCNSVNGVIGVISIITGFNCDNLSNFIRF